MTTAWETELLLGRSIAACSLTVRRDPAAASPRLFTGTTYFSLYLRQPSDPPADNAGCKLDTNVTIQGSHDPEGTCKSTNWIMCID